MMLYCPPGCGLLPFLQKTFGASAVPPPPAATTRFPPPPPLCCRQAATTPIMLPPLLPPPPPRCCRHRHAAATTAAAAATLPPRCCRHRRCAVAKLPHKKTSVPDIGLTMGKGSITLEWAPEDRGQCRKLFDCRVFFYSPLKNMIGQKFSLSALPQ
jgi:hypothetical protein